MGMNGLFVSEYKKETVKSYIHSHIHIDINNVTSKDI